MVDILLATYNGEAYVEELVRSIIEQSYTEWRLLIRDDNSTDDTLNILKRLASEDQRIQMVKDDGVRLGVTANFLCLLSYATAPYTMFCDQDDVWLPHKVERMMEAILSCDNSIPQVVYANSYLWNKERGIIANKNTLTYPSTLQQMLFLNTGIQGASSIFNRAMREQLQRPLASYAMYDHTLLLAGICLGQVHYVHQSLMYYRQHDNNVTGHAPGSMFKKILQLWKNRHIPLVSAAHYEGVRAFYEGHKYHLKMDDQRVLELYLSLVDYSSLKRVQMVLRGQFQLFDSTALLILKMLIRRYI